LRKNSKDLVTKVEVMQVYLYINRNEFGYAVRRNDQAKYIACTKLTVQFSKNITGTLARVHCGGLGLEYHVGHMSKIYRDEVIKQSFK
jgi:hypothetical protein